MHKNVESRILTLKKQKKIKYRVQKRNCHPLMKARGDSYAFAPCTDLQKSGTWALSHVKSNQIRPKMTHILRSPNPVHLMMYSICK